MGAFVIYKFNEYLHTLKTWLLTKKHLQFVDILFKSAYLTGIFNSNYLIRKITLSKIVNTYAINSTTITLSFNNKL